MKFGMMMHNIGLLKPRPLCAREKSKFKNPRWQKAIILRVKLVIYPVGLNFLKM